MVRHIVIWNHADHVPAERRPENARRIKQELEAIAQEMDGVVELKVYIDPMEGCNGDIMLYSVFASAAALAAYQVSDAHKRVGSTYVKPNVQNRMCMDCEL